MEVNKYFPINYGKNEKQLFLHVHHSHELYTKIQKLMEEYIEKGDLAKTDEKVNFSVEVKEK